MSPRRDGSNWSMRNTKHVEKLIADGKMQPAGMAKVETAKKNGRWDAAYAGSADMELPQDFLDALEKNTAAKTYFETLSRSKKFMIYSQLNSAKRVETKQKRMEIFLDMLSRGQFE